MLLTGTSVSALARGIGRGLRGALPSAATRRRGPSPAPHAGLAEERRQRRVEDRETEAGATDVMSAYPEDDG